MTQRLDRLVKNAENLLEQAVAMGPGSDVTVLELKTGGYYLIAGCDHDLGVVQSEHGAKAGWQVRNGPGGTLVSGRSGDHSCLLKKDHCAGKLAGVLRDTPAYLLV